MSRGAADVETICVRTAPTLAVADAERRARGRAISRRQACRPRRSMQRPCGGCRPAVHAGCGMAADFAGNGNSHAPDTTRDAANSRFGDGPCGIWPVVIDLAPSGLAFAGRTHGADNRNKRRTAVCGIFELPLMAASSECNTLLQKMHTAASRPTRGSAHRFVKIPAAGRWKDSRVRRPWCKFRVRKSGNWTSNVTEISAHCQRPRWLYRKFRSDPVFQFPRSRGAAERNSQEREPA